MGYLKLKFVLQHYFPTPNINYSNLNYFTRHAAGALRAPMSAISGDDRPENSKLFHCLVPT